MRLANAFTWLRSLKLQIGKTSSQSKYAAIPSEFFRVEGVRFHILILLPISDKIIT